MKKNKISKNWINKQRRDIYVRQSKVDGYRARSVYKLIEIDEKFKIFRGGMLVIDIGAAPGSWSQYASKVVKGGKIISIDLKEMQTIENSIQIKGDFMEENVQNKIKSYQDLSGKYIGVNRYAKYFKVFDEDKTIDKFKASGVMQNIELLLRNRIDAFIHYEQSTLPLLAKADIDNNIVQTPYQPNIEARHYLAISSHSVLVKRQHELQQIIAKAIKNKRSKCS